MHYAISKEIATAKGNRHSSQEKREKPRQAITPARHTQSSQDRARIPAVSIRQYLKTVYPR